MHELGYAVRTRYLILWYNKITLPAHLDRLVVMKHNRGKPYEWTGIVCNTSLCIFYGYDTLHIKRKGTLKLYLIHTICIHFSDEKSSYNILNPIEKLFRLIYFHPLNKRCMVVYKWLTLYEVEYMEVDQIYKASTLIEWRPGFLDSVTKRIVTFPFRLLKPAIKHIKSGSSLLDCGQVCARAMKQNGLSHNYISRSRIQRRFWRKSIKVGRIVLSYYKRYSSTFIKPYQLVCVHV